MIALLRRILLVHIELQTRGLCPRSGTFVAVFNAQFLHALELTVEVGQFHLQVALVVVHVLNVEYRLVDDQVNGTGTGLEVYVQRRSVPNLYSLES